MAIHPTTYVVGFLADYFVNHTFSSRFSRPTEMSGPGHWKYIQYIYYTSLPAHCQLHNTQYVCFMPSSVIINGLNTQQMPFLMCLRSTHTISSGVPIEISSSLAVFQRAQSSPRIDLNRTLHTPGVSALADISQTEPSRTWKFPSSNIAMLYSSRFLSRMQANTAANIAEPAAMPTGDRFEPYKNNRPKTANAEITTVIREILVL